MKKFNITSWGVPLLLAIFMLSSCAKDTAPVKAKDEGNLIVTIPQSGLFGISKDQEKAIAEIAVLVFNTKGELHRRPIYIDGSQGRPSGDDLLFDIKLQPRAYGDIMILANASEACKGAIDTTHVGLQRDQILALLKFENPVKWNAASDSDYKPIPMWGGTGMIVITQNKTTKTKLVRMLAGVDLDIPSQLVADDLKISEIWVYNTNKAGQIIPDKANWDEANLVVTKPTIPAGFTRDTPLIYTEIKDKKSCIGEIYLFEASNTLVPNPLDAACLVLKARYKTDAQDTYYAIHLEKKDGAGVVISKDILRNHKYKVNIISVSGSGWPDPGQALEHGNTNIKTEIVVWDNGKFTEGVVDGQNVFKVSKGSFTLSKDAHDDTSTENKVTVFSNEVSGWKVNEITDEAGAPITWLSIAVAEQTGIMNQSKEISLLLTENMDVVERIGYVHFAAGHLKYKLKVTQKKVAARLSVDKNLFDDIEGFGIGTGEYYSYKIDSVFNISSNTSWTIVSSHPGVLSVDRDSGTGDSEIRVILQPSSLYIPKDDYTLTITGIGADAPVVVDVTQFGMDIYVDNNRGTATRAMPDANFVAACKAHVTPFDGGDNKLSIAEALSAPLVLNLDNKSIADLKGIEYFRKITALNCPGNQLPSLDVTKNVMLTNLSCGDNQLISLSVSENARLTILHCRNNQLTELDVSKNLKLTTLLCEKNQLASLDVSECVNLRDVWCGQNLLSSLNLIQNTELKNLSCFQNQLTSLDVTKNVMLTALYCNSNQLTTLDVTQNVMLTQLDCEWNQLTTLNVTQNVMLTVLGCSNNILTLLNLPQNSTLTRLNCKWNQLTTLDVRQSVMLTQLDCEWNKLTSMDVTKNVMLTHLYLGVNPLPSLDVTQNVKLIILGLESTQVTLLDLTQNVGLIILNANDNQFTSLNVSKNIKLSNLKCSNNLLSGLDMTKNVELMVLECTGNPSLTSLDLSKNTALRSVSAYTSSITTVYVWWVGGGTAEKPSGWSFPASTTYTYKP